MSDAGFPERSLAIRRAAARLCGRLGWAPLHEVPLPNGRRADILALRPDGGFVCIEVKSPWTWTFRRSCCRRRPA